MLLLLQCSWNLCRTGNTCFSVVIILAQRRILFCCTVPVQQRPQVVNNSQHKFCICMKFYIQRVQLFSVRHGNVSKCDLICVFGVSGSQRLSPVSGDLTDSVGWAQDIHIFYTYYIYIYTYIYIYL